MSCTCATIDAPLRRIDKHANALSYAMRRTQAAKVRRSLPDHPRLALCSRTHSSHPIVCHCTFIHALAYDAHAFFTCYACVLQVFLQRSRAQIDAFLNAGMPQEHAAICRYHRYAVSISTKRGSAHANPERSFRQHRDHQRADHGHFCGYIRHFCVHEHEQEHEPGFQRSSRARCSARGIVERRQHHASGRQAAEGADRIVAEEAGGVAAADGARSNRPPATARALLPQWLLRSVRRRRRFRRRCKRPRPSLPNCCFLLRASRRAASSIRRPEARRSSHVKQHRAGPYATYRS